MEEYYSLLISMKSVIFNELIDNIKVIIVIIDKAMVDSLNKFITNCFDNETFNTSSIVSLIVLHVHTGIDLIHNRRQVLSL